MICCCLAACFLVCYWWIALFDVVVYYIVVFGCLVGVVGFGGSDLLWFVCVLRCVLVC